MEEILPNRRTKQIWNFWAISLQNHERAWYEIQESSAYRIDSKFIEKFGFKTVMGNQISGIRSGKLGNMQFGWNLVGNEWFQEDEVAISKFSKLCGCFLGNTESVYVNCYRFSWKLIHRSCTIELKWKYDEHILEIACPEIGQRTTKLAPVNNLDIWRSCLPLWWSFTETVEVPENPNHDDRTT